MKHFVYIIYSKSADRYYVGESVNPGQRLVQHNSRHYKHSSTKVDDDWLLFLTIGCTSRAQALKLEKFIKSMRNRSFYHKLKGDPQFVEKLLDRFPN